MSRPRSSEEVLVALTTECCIPPAAKQEDLLAFKHAFKKCEHTCAYLHTYRHIQAHMYYMYYIWECLAVCKRANNFVNLVCKIK